MFSSKIISSSVFNNIKIRPFSLLSLFDNYVVREELKEVKVVNPPKEMYTVVQINPLTLEEKLIMYPVFEEEEPVKNHIIIDVE